MTAKLTGLEIEPRPEYHRTIFVTTALTSREIRGLTKTAQPMDAKVGCELPRDFVSLRRHCCGLELERRCEMKLRFAQLSAGSVVSE